MGRWSQRRRGGGGQSINFILAAEFSGTEAVNLTYLLPIDDGDVEGNDFKADGPDLFGQSTAQVNATTITVSWSDPISAATTITYQGLAPGILNPQTIAVF